METILKDEKSGPATHRPGQRITGRRVGPDGLRSRLGSAWRTTAAFRPVLTGVPVVARCLRRAKSTILAALLLGSAVDAAGADPEALLRQYQCTICHARAETLAGPSWVDIAARYKGNPRAIAILAGVVKKGEHGDAVWPMPPLPQVPDADARAMIVHILAQRE